MSEEMKSVISNRKFYKYTELFEKHGKDGDFSPFEKGIFVGKEPNKFNEDRHDWIFEVNNEEHVLNTCGHLDWQMSKLKEGTVVTPIYKGKLLLTQGKMEGKEAHQWDIQFKVPESSTPKAEESGDTIPF